MISLAWPVMAEAIASRRHDADVVVGDQRAWAAKVNARWRSRSAVTAIPLHSSASDSPWVSGWRGGGRLAGMALSSMGPSAAGGCCWAASTVAPATQSHRVAVCSATRTETGVS